MMKMVRANRVDNALVANPQGGKASSTQAADTDSLQNSSPDGDLLVTDRK